MTKRNDTYVMHNVRRTYTISSKLFSILVTKNVKGVDSLHIFGATIQKVSDKFWWIVGVKFSWIRRKQNVCSQKIHILLL